jgi:S-(hydroxymethyl)glutathione dehydrogenase/alcohol dehydrogenase
LYENSIVNAGPITTFMHYAIISEDRITKIPNDFSLMYSALIGCAIPTGYGAVVNVAQPKPGMSIGIFGCGGIGMCALMSARITGCSPIVAIDTNDKKLSVAKCQGATYTVNPMSSDPVSLIQQLCPEGLDYSIEATGIPSVMELALICVKNQGGIATIIGNAKYEDRLSFDPHQLNLGKQLRGTWGGDVIPDRDFPRIVRLIQSGIFDPSFLISKIYSLDEINTALNDLEKGRVIRPIIDMEL